MLESQNQKKELMIVCDEKLMEYANYLMALIGQKDDDGDRIVGVKDGSVTAAIYTPKHYKDTLPKITSNTHILFIGSFKEAKEQGKNVDIKFNQYGMRYGWLGKRAVMYVKDTMLKKDEYEEFISFCKERQNEFDAVTVNRVNTLPDAVKWAGAFLPVVHPVGYALNLIATYGLISGSIAHKKIKKQQYRCLTLLLYLEGLQKFLEG